MEACSYFQKVHGCLSYFTHSEKFFVETAALLKKCWAVERCF